MEKPLENNNEIEVLGNKNLTNHIVNVRRDIPKYFDREYIRERIQEITDHEDRMFILFLWMSGLRVTEAISIKKKDINIRDKVITVRWLKSRKYNERNVPVHSNLAQILAVYTGGMNLDHKVFPFTRQRAWQITKKWFDTNPHTFRHSFAVNYLREGGNIVNLYRILGHSKIQTTMEYLKIVPTDLSKELETINF
jgi:integrase/recombinase XerD